MSKKEKIKILLVDDQPAKLTARASALAERALGQALAGAAEVPP